MIRKGILQINRVVGNNVVLTMDPRNSREYVLFGKGIGFGAKGSRWIKMEDPRIEKRYRLDEEQPIRQFQEWIENIEPKVIYMSEKIIHLLEERIGIKDSSKIYFALPSHIQFALYRLQNGMAIHNPFLHETRMNFPLEYEIASRAAAMMYDSFGIAVPDDEVGFLALHIRSCIGIAPQELVCRT